MKSYAKWFYVGGFVVAGLAGMFSFSAEWLSLVLLLVAILAGFYFEFDNFVKEGVAFMVFSTVYGAFGMIPAVGSYLTGFFGGVLGFWGAYLLTAMVVHFVKKYFMSK